MLHVLVLVVCALVLYVACEWFVNAVEWLGAHLGVGNGAVGSVLAAIGTALPESVVTLVAVLFGGADVGQELGMGAALGGPLVVGTIAYAAVGLTLVLTRARGPVTGVDLRRLGEDQTFFLIIGSILLVLGLVSFPGKQWLGLVAFAAYIAYVRREITRDDDAASHEDLEPLRLASRHEHPPALAVWVQTLGSLAVIFVVSNVFVDQLEWVGPALGLPATLVAVLLAPVATELPETLNGIIWSRSGKTQLAVSNVAGAMMVQSTVPAGIALLMTPWRYDRPLAIAAVATLASVAYLRLLVLTGRLTAGRLAGAGLFYVAFAAGVVVTS